MLNEMLNLLQLLFSNFHIFFPKSITASIKKYLNVRFQISIPQTQSPYLNSPYKCNYRTKKFRNRTPPSRLPIDCTHFSSANLSSSFFFLALTASSTVTEDLTTFSSSLMKAILAALASRSFCISLAVSSSSSIF